MATLLTTVSALGATIALAGAAVGMSARSGDGCCPAAAATATMACSAAEPAVLAGAMGSDIVDTAVAAGDFTTLVAAVKAAGLVDALKGDGPFTVFAPSDAAFAKLPKGTLESLLKPENKGTLTAILTYHVVAGELPAKDVLRRDGAVTLAGQRIDFDGATVDGANIIATDIECSNGVIHVIDSVILPTSDSIVDIAASTGTFGTLLAAAQAAGLADTLANGGPFTVFAPTDDAFAKLPAGTVESLLENPKQLAEILKYHVVSGRAYAADAAKAGRVGTLQGGEVVFSIRDGRLFVDNAGIVATDIDAKNGVVHVIDSVILP